MASRYCKRQRRKWAGLVVCVILAATWIATARRQTWVYGHRAIVIVGNGAVGGGVNLLKPQQFHVQTSKPRPIITGYTVMPWGAHLVKWYYVGTVPIWMVLLAVGLPTWLLWRKDRRWRRENCCRECGYDLSAAVSDRCPECGTALEIQVND